MKNLKTRSILSYFMVASIFITFFSSCSEDGNSNETLGSAPVINTVSRAEAGSLAATNIGYANNMYIIQGSGFSSVQKVYFNDTDTYFNPTLVTENSIFVNIDQNTPYENGSNELKLVAKTGTAIYPFVIAPPAPQILRGFNPVNANDGEEITIYGNFFLDPIVTVGDVEATIVSNTLTEIKVILPPNSQNKYINVETISGEDDWGTAVGTALYDDTWYGGYAPAAWNNHVYVTDPEIAFQGNSVMKKNIPGWDNIQGEWSWNDQISQYTGIKFVVRSETAGRLVLIFNGSYWGDASRAFDTSSEWKEVKYTWAQLGNPQALQNISFQEFSGNGAVYYFDNITFTVD